MYRAGYGKGHFRRRAILHVLWLDSQGTGLSPHTPTTRQSNNVAVS